MDDILVTGHNDKVISKLTSDLYAQFALKQLGSLHYFLGIKATRDASGLYMSKSKYIVDLLQRLNMTGVSPCSSPAALGESWSKLGGEVMEDLFIHRSTIGALQYVTMICPDIAHVLNKLSQFLGSEIHSLASLQEGFEISQGHNYPCPNVQTSLHFTWPTIWMIDVPRVRTLSF